MLYHVLNFFIFGIQILIPIAFVLILLKICLVFLKRGDSHE